jgi:hypothetical protein
LPSSSWTPPSAAVSPIDALPSHPDTTTARRPVPELLLGDITTARHRIAPPIDGRAEGERSGEIIIDPVTQPSAPIEPRYAVEPAPIVIEIDALTEEDMLNEALDEAFAAAAMTQDFVAAGPVLGLDAADTAAIDLRVVPGFDSDGPDDKTQPGPLRPRKSSG